MIAQLDDQQRWHGNRLRLFGMILSGLSNARAPLSVERRWVLNRHRQRKVQHARLGMTAERPAGATSIAIRTFGNQGA